MPFADIPNQKAVTELLARAIRNGRLAHAYLFVGDRGVGLEETALALAQAANCAEFAARGDACGTCASCRAAAAGNHPDLRWLRPESRSRIITIDQIKELQKAVYQKSLGGLVKFGLLCDADRLKAEASNAFLKTLEEPPPRTVFVLMTASAESLPDTIIARCQRLNFSSVPLTRADTSVADAMMALTAQFLPKKTVLGTYRMVEGILALLQEGSAACEEKVRSKHDFERYEGVAEKAFFEDLEDRLKAQVEAERRLLRQGLVRVIYEWYRDCLVIAEGGGRDAVLHPEHFTAMEDMARALGAGKLVSNLDVLDRLGEELATTNVQESLAFEAALLRCLPPMAAAAR